MLSGRYITKRLELCNPIKTATQHLSFIKRLFLTLNDGDLSAVSELATFDDASYYPETRQLAQSYLDQHFLPNLSAFTLDQLIQSTSALEKCAPEARISFAAIEMGLLALKATQSKKPLWKILGGVNKPLAVRIVLSLTNDIKKIKHELSSFQEKGYRHFKLKINQASSIAHLEKVYTEYPDLDIVLDANESLDKNSACGFLEIKQLIPYIEQPFPRHDWKGLAWLTKEGLNLCLDESVRDIIHLKKMKSLNAAHRITLKPALWGGFSKAKEALKYCSAHQINCSIGGLYETAVGRAYNLAFATLSGLDHVVELAPPSLTWAHDDYQLQHSVKNGSWHLSDCSGLGLIL